MISSYLSAELSATCNALGYSNGSKYYIDPYVKETMTDLIRYLRRDDEDHTIRRHLGSAKVLQTDLLPILINHSDKYDLFDVLLRLLVNLTNPALLIYQEELPSERTARHYFLQMISQLQSYKEAFTDQHVWEILVKNLGDLLQIAYHDRDEDQSRTMERILILARNVLQVPTDSDVEKRPDNDASIHDQVLWSLHQAGMCDLILYIASTDNEQQYYMHILEIVSLMLREQNPATLASAVMQRSIEEKERDEKELLEIRRKENLEKQTKFKKYAGARHSRFGGTYVVKNVKSISDNDLIYHRPLSNAANLTFDSTKQKCKVHKNKMALTYSTSERRSAFSVQFFLKEFCVEFLNGAYNPLMQKVRENLMRAVGQPNDETYYFWAIKYFMEFNRLYKFQVKLVSETMHQHIFHFVQTQMENWLEQMVVDKKKIPIWSRRVHQALKAYQELLLTLQAMDKSPDHSVKESSRIIKSNIFYQSEYRELVVFLFNVYDERKFSRQYLKDLIETTHIFIKMLDQFCSKYQNVIVQAKAKRVPKKKKKASMPKKSEGATTRDLETIWDQVGPELSAVLQGSTDLLCVIPFDAASDVPMGEQKVEAMKKIQLELKQGNFEQAIALLRASREVWPENDSFGQPDMAPDEEFMAMREIFMADIGELTAETVAVDVEDEDNEEGEDEEDPQNIVIPEQPFNLIEFVARFASPRVLSAVSLLLDQFERNSAFTNRCIVKLLHRVTWDCKMPALIFQASIFRSFQRILKSTNTEHKELVKFATFIIRKFVEVSKTNNKIYMELLFWKSKKEAEEIEVGYGSGTTKSHSSKNVWREEQEDELRRLAAEYERYTPEPDAVGWIMKNMINQTRTRRAVIKKMKELYLIVGNIKPPKEKPKEFSEEEETELRALYEQFKGAADPMNCILGRMSLPRSRKTVIEKLIDVGLVSDKKQLYKKYEKKKKEKSSANNPWEKRSDDESIYDSWSDSDGENARESEMENTVTRTHKGQPSMAQICCNLRKVMEAGLTEPLEWLKSSLQEVMDDLVEEEEEDSTALLPLTPACVQAMDIPVFLQLLDVLFIDKPTHQETYWRVPGQWKAQELTVRINIIRDALNGNLPNAGSDAEEEDVSQASHDPPNYSIKARKLKKKLEHGEIAGERTRTYSSNSDEDRPKAGQFNLEEVVSPTLKQRKRMFKKIRKHISNELESSSENSLASSEDNILMTEKSTTLTKIISDSEDEVLSSRHNYFGSRKSTFKTKVMSDYSNSDDESNSLHSSIVDTNTTTNYSSVKKQMKITSDSEEELVPSSALKPFDTNDRDNSIVSSGTESIGLIRGKNKKNKILLVDSDDEEVLNKSKRPASSLEKIDVDRSRIEEFLNSKSINGREFDFNSSIKAKRKRQNIESDSDNENTTSLNIEQSPENESIVANSKRTRLLINSDSD